MDNKKMFLANCLTLLIVVFANAQRSTTSFDNDWRFFNGDVNGAAQIAFTDATWPKVDIPHDWSIEGTYNRNNKTGRGGGYLPGGIGWYRKKFAISDEYKNHNIAVQFDGIMSNSDVWINGHHLGKRPFGYIGLHYDLTPYLKFGKNSVNIIAVKADNSAQPASRWYSGAGIYRHTHLIITKKVHIDPWGVFVTTPEVSEMKAIIAVQTNITNTSGAPAQIILLTTLVDQEGNEVATTKSDHTLMAGKNITVRQQMAVTNPSLWDAEKPVMYKLVSKVLSAGKMIDDLSTPFGIREFHFDASTGFYLNGKHMKLKGVCLHHDGGAVGAAVPLRIWEKRLETLKAIGVNAIRTAHNPMAPEFLDLCDRMGLMVMNETFDTWTAKKANADAGYNLYFNDWWEKDTRDIVMRDRNHPSIIMYSVGNEIRDNLKEAAGFKKYKDQQQLIHELDPTRPVTMAIFRPNVAGVYTNGFVEMMDVVGQNYRENELVALHQAKPELKVIGTENGHARETWLILRDKPFMSGQFLWTGIDYLGEADWPAIGSGAGLIDRLGGTKPRTFERQSWWSEKPMVHAARNAGNAGTGMLVSDWTPSDFDTYDEAVVQVFSNCEEVELILNGKSLGIKLPPSDDAPLEWKLTFEPGSLKAIGKNKGSIVATHEMETAGKPEKIMLTADKTQLVQHWDDVVFVKATITDAKGIKCPGSDNLVTFKMTGPGMIAAVDNGNISSHESYRGMMRQAYNGECTAIIKAKDSNGNIIITATADGLGERSIAIEAVPSANNFFIKENKIPGLKIPAKH